MGTTDAARVALAVALAGAGCVRAEAGYERARVALEPRLPLVPAEVRAAELGMTSAEVRAILGRPLSAEDAVRVALLNQPDVQTALARVGVARAAVLAAALLPNPTAEGELRLPVDGGPATFEGALLLDVGTMARTALARGAAEDELRASALESAGRILDVAYGTRVAFLRYVADREVRDLLALAVDAMRASWEAAVALGEAGNVRAIDRLEQRVLYEESRLALAEAELALADDREALSARMGLTGDDTEWSAVDALPEVAPPPDDEERLEARAIEASLELEILEARRRAAGRRVGLARALGALPDARAGLAVQREDETWGLGVAAELGLPVLSQNQGGVAAARARLGVLEAEQAALGVRIRSTLRRARHQMRSAHARARFYRETLLPLRDEVLTETVRQYNAMAVDVFALVAARRAQIEAQIGHARALGAFWMARAAFDQILAGRLVEVAPPGRAGLEGAAGSETDRHDEEDAP